MKKTCSILFIVTLGILLSTTLFSKNDSTITLTKDNHIVFSGPVNDMSVAQAQEATNYVKMVKRSVMWNF